MDVLCCGHLGLWMKITNSSRSSRPFRASAIQKYSLIPRWPVSSNRTTGNCRRLWSISWIVPCHPRLFQNPSNSGGSLFAEWPLAIDATSLSALRQILDRMLLGSWDRELYSPSSSDFLLDAGGNKSDPGTAFRAKCVIALMMAHLQERDECWLDLAIGQLGVSRSVLQSYLEHGDSMLLANLVYIIRHILLFHSEYGDWPCFCGISLRILEATSKSDAQRTL
jgi:hypothetical protein